MVHCRELGSFALNSVHQDASFELSVAMVSLSALEDWKVKLISLREDLSGHKPPCQPVFHFNGQLLYHGYYT